MRNQSNELLQIAKDLRDYVKSLNLPIDKDKDGNDIGVHVQISSRVKVHYNVVYDYASMEFSPWPKTVNVALFETAGYSNNTITINVELVDDIELDCIILLVQADIAIFKSTKLIEDVYTSTSSI